MTIPIILPGATLEPGRTYILAAKGHAAYSTQAAVENYEFTATPLVDSPFLHEGWSLAAVRVTSDPIPASHVYLAAMRAGAERGGVAVFMPEAGPEEWGVYFAGKEWQAKLTESASAISESLAGAVSGVATLLKWAPWLAVGTIVLGLAIVLAVVVKS